VPEELGFSKGSASYLCIGVKPAMPQSVCLPDLTHMRSLHSATRCDVWSLDAGGLVPD